METHEMNLSDSLLTCIYDLNQKQLFESKVIYSTMREKFTLATKEVDQLVEKLVAEGKIHRSEQNGSLNYYARTIGKKPNTDVSCFYTTLQKREMTSYLAKCVKEINTVYSIFSLRGSLKLI